MGGMCVRMCVGGMCEGVWMCEGVGGMCEYVGMVCILSTTAVHMATRQRDDIQGGT